MSDSETSETGRVEWALAEAKSQLSQERAFHKVYGAVGVLFFLYGLCYGVYLSK